uniref:Reverse transcriptase domain-containing protein n=1 Tax=Tanacetum cinerariifolium TaxID=118510 RepID=A0A6L2J8B1_TANCI|nr:reverse transcriptase domain-containing protein [Tanacetum cinerariifolium]
MYIKIIPDDEIAIDAIPLATKPPIIVDRKIIKEGKISSYHLIRADGSLKRYSSMIQMLQYIDREDLETLWKLVKAKYRNTRPEEGYERVPKGMRRYANVPYGQVKENQENDKIGSKPDKNGKCVEAGKSLKQLQLKDKEKPKKTKKEWPKTHTRNEYYCFLDGFSEYFQIPIGPCDQEKTTFTCPYGTFAYRRMPFGLCNAPGTFQRCMLVIFHDMVEKTMEVFMDDFLVFGNSFKTCLSRLDKMLQRCEDTKLCLNWKKSHFMVKEGIVLGHKISRNGIEVDKAKVDVITKLPHPTTVKGVQSFLGHADFY